MASNKNKHTEITLRGYYAQPLEAEEPSEAQISAGWHSCMCVEGHPSYVALNTHNIVILRDRFGV